MNSSTSNSEAPAPIEARDPAGAAAWRRFDRIAVQCALGLSLGAYLLLIVADPYDTGRFFQWPTGIADASPRTANASRGRDPRFNAAVIGNSRGQLLDPARLSALTGRRFVQLTVPATAPREQLAVLHWFARRHDDIGAIVLVMDESWCSSDLALPTTPSFPFWLYTDDDLVYLKSIMRRQAFDRLWRRVRIAFHHLPASEPTGYWNYDLIAGAPPDAQQLENATSMAIEQVADAPLPAIARLRDEIARYPDAPIVVVAPPAFHTLLPIQSGAIARLASCKAAFASLMAARAHGAFIDFLVDGPIARDVSNFRDIIHYRSNVARIVEQAIAKAMAGS